MFRSRLGSCCAFKRYELQLLFFWQYTRFHFDGVFTSCSRLSNPIIWNVASHWPNTLSKFLTFVFLFNRSAHSAEPRSVIPFPLLIVLGVLCIVYVRFVWGTIASICSRQRCRAGCSSFMCYRFGGRVVKAVRSSSRLLVIFQHRLC